MLAAVSTALVLGAGVANADSFEFSYEFHSGEIVSGTVDGTANGNLVESLSNIVITFDGTPATYSPFYGSSWDDTQGPFGGWRSGGAVLSFDGTENNFLFSELDYYDGQPSPTEFWYDFTPGYDGIQGIVAVDPESNLSKGYRGDGSFGPYGTWTMLQVPEPGSIALVGMALPGVGLARRRLGG